MEKTDEPNVNNSGGVVNSGPKGPRTPEGKGRSKLNAITHGIFSKVVVLKTESQVEYDSLLQGLRQACKPQGKLEEILVDKLTTILWRYRRLINAESGEISENLSSIDRIDLRIRERDSLNAEKDQRKARGLIGMAYDPETLTGCLRELSSFRERIKAKGFTKIDRFYLAEIYGYDANAKKTIAVKSLVNPNLFVEYERYSDTAEAAREHSMKSEKCREQVLICIEKEIDRLKGDLDALNASRAERAQFEKQRRSLPQTDQMERLLRYEASLERAFDRTLLQLERLQRMRLGQPVTPPIKLDVTR